MLNNCSCSFWNLNERSCNYLSQTGSACKHCIRVAFKNVKVVLVGIVAVVDESWKTVGKHPQRRLIVNLWKLLESSGKFRKTWLNLHLHVNRINQSRIVFFYNVNVRSFKRFFDVPAANSIPLHLPEENHICSWVIEVSSVLGSWSAMPNKFEIISMHSPPRKFFVFQDLSRDCKFTGRWQRVEKSCSETVGFCWGKGNRKNSVRPLKL